MKPVTGEGAKPWKFVRSQVSSQLQEGGLDLVNLSKGVKYQASSEEGRERGVWLNLGNLSKGVKYQASYRRGG